MSEKKTYRHWVSGYGKYDGGYYEFKTFKIYWAYRWLDAEEIDYRLSHELYKPKNKTLLKAIGSIMVYKKQIFDFHNYTLKYKK